RSQEVIRGTRLSSVSKGLGTSIRERMRIRRSGTHRPGESGNPTSREGAPTVRNKSSVLALAPCSAPFRTRFLGAAGLALAFAWIGVADAGAQQAASKKPNILVIMGDDIGGYNASIYNRGDMGYETPNIDRIGKEGALFLSWYAQQSCTAGRAAFVTGQSPIRTGLTKVGLPGADVGLSEKDPSIGEVMKSLGYATGQFGKNHLGDRNNFLPCVHGFDEFFGNLYHLNAEEEPENPDYPKDPRFR